MKNLDLLKNLTILLVLLFSASSMKAQSKSIFDIMHYQEELAVTLVSDFDYLRSNRRAQDYQKAKLTFTDESGVEQQWDMKVRLRGNFRRLHCEDIPPLKWKFKKSELATAGLADFNDMKLVTYCTATKQEAYDLLMKEYLAYTLYNELTENSFRVQLLNITFKESTSGKKTRQWAFLIEDTAQLKARIGAETVESIYNNPIESFRAEDRKLVALFEYIIGNSDWSYYISRNVKLVQKDGKIIPIPYDFDFSGLVNAPYAVPNPNFEMVSLTERIFMGFPEDHANLYNTLYRVYGLREVLLNKVRDFDRLSIYTRKEVLAYLNTYFEDFENIHLGIPRQIKVISISDNVSE